MIHTSYPILIILSVTSLCHLSMFITMADDLDKLLVQLNGTSNVDVSDDLDKLLVNLNVDRDHIKVSPHPSCSSSRSLTLLLHSLWTSC